MQARKLSIWMVIGQLASQLFAMPHAHAGQSAEDVHAWQPHVHLSGQDHHHHHHAHAAKLGHTIGLAGDRQAVVESLDDHDSDALYLSGAVQATSGSVKSENAITQCYLAFTPAVFATTANAAADCAKTTARHEADLTGRHCALYLSLGILRI